MGNSKQAARCQLPTEVKGESLAHSENGILGSIHGQYIAAALGTLGPATRESANHHQVIVEAGHAGTVRLFIEKKRAQHGRYTHYFWSAYRAGAVGPPPQPRDIPG
ncbi:hypothetical protein ACIP1U_30705 [Cupriavidus sp. NPDC089707]|uniref:hypothetical protein n=1 Tax=Cupriavidus sp. NPDC089707 TaxID=3363963 RepID=UPI0037F6AFCD